MNADLAGCRRLQDDFGQTSVSILSPICFLLVSVKIRPICVLLLLVAEVLQKEAPGGFEPPMSDLQSDALATWPRRHLSRKVKRSVDLGQVQVLYRLPILGKLRKN